MDNIEAQYALFGLTEDNRRRLVQLTQLASPGDQDARSIIIETVLVQDGYCTVIETEERSA